MDNEELDEWQGHPVQPGDLIAYWEIREGLVDAELVEELDFGTVERHLAQCARCTQELQTWEVTEAFVDQVQSRRVLQPEQTEALDALVESHLAQWGAESVTLKNNTSDFLNVILVLNYAMARQRRVLQVATLAGVLYAQRRLNQRSPHLRQSEIEEKTEIDRFEVDPIQFPDFLLLLDIKPINEMFYLRLTMYDQGEHMVAIDGCEVSWSSIDEFKGSSITGDDGVAEFIYLEPGVHEFSFSLFPNITFQIELPKS